MFKFIDRHGSKLVFMLGLTCVIAGAFAAFATPVDAAPREVQAGYTCHWENQFVRQEWVCN